MKAIVYRATGDPSVLELVDREIRDPGRGEVCVRIMVSAVNPTDGSRAAVPDQASPCPSRRSCRTKTAPERWTPSDPASSVSASVTGSGWPWPPTSAPTAGQPRVAVLPAERVFPLPENAGFDLGASWAFPQSPPKGPDHRRGRPRRSAGSGRQVVLVSGGAGAVGHAAIQLAKWAGAVVITTVSGPAKAALATAAGADHVINYRESHAAAEIRRIAPRGGPDRGSGARAERGTRPGSSPHPRLHRGLRQQRRRSGDPGRAQALQPQRPLPVVCSTRFAWRRCTTPPRTSMRPSPTVPFRSEKPQACRCIALTWPTRPRPTRRWKRASSARC